MSNEIPALYWMVLIAVLSGFFAAILFYTAMLIKELATTVVDAREIVKNSNKIVLESTEILSDAREVVSMVKGTVTEVNSTIIEPIRRVGSLLTMVTGFVDGFTGNKEK